MGVISEYCACGIPCVILGDSIFSDHKWDPVPLAKCHKILSPSFSDGSSELVTSRTGVPSYLDLVFSSEASLLQNVGVLSQIGHRTL